MALNSNRLSKANAESKGGGGGNILKLKNGKNYIRVFKFSHKVTKADFSMGRYSARDGVEVGDMSEEVERCSPVHFRDDKGVNCMLHDCSYCAEADEYKDSQDKNDQKMFKALKARKTFFINAVNMDDVEKGMQICGVPPTCFNAILSYILDPEYGEEILGCEGRDFVITLNKDALPQDMYDVKLRDQKNSEELDADLEDASQDLFGISMLDPGWSRDDALRQSASKDAADDKPAPRGKSKVDAEDDGEPAPRSSGKTKPKADDKNPFDDKDKPGNTDKDGMPWEDGGDGRKRDKGETSSRSKPKAQAKPELPDFVVKNKPVCFKGDDDELMEGIVVGILVDEGKIEVDTPDSVWTIKYEEAIKPKAKRSK